MIRLGLRSGAYSFGSSLKPSLGSSLKPGFRLNARLSPLSHTRSYGSYGNTHTWLRRTWWQYRRPLLFTAGVLAFNSLALPYIFTLPGLSGYRRNPESLVYTIMAANAAVFLIWRFPTARTLKYVYRYGLLQKDSNFNQWSMIGSAFSHQSAMHLAVNMFVLYQMGMPLARLLGPDQFMAAYLDGAVLSSLVSIMAPLITGYRFLNPSLGASGAVFTMFGLLAYLVPNLRVGLMFIPIPLSGWSVFLGSLGLNVAGMFYRWGRIDYAGHVGGSLAALAYGSYLRSKNPPRRRSF